MKKWLLLFCSTLSFGVQAQDKNFRCIDTTGKTLFEIKAKYVYSFSGGYARIQRTVVEGMKAYYRTGYVDGFGKEVITAQYAKGTEYRSGVAWVQDAKTKLWVMIDRWGKEISERKYPKVGFMIEGMCAVYLNDRMGFVDSTGKQVIECKYIGSPAFSEGLVCVCPYDSKDEKYGFLNKKGEIAIPFQYKQPGFSNFEGGECRVQINGKTNLINKKGEVVFTPQLTNNMENFSYGMALAYTKPDRSGFGFFGRDQQWKIKPIYDHATSFKNGYSLVEKKGKQGVIDTTGKEILPVIYDDVYGDAIESGYWTAEKDEKRILFDVNGKEIKLDANIKYLQPKDESGWVRFTTTDGKKGFMTLTGKIKIPAKFTRADGFKEGKCWVQP